jgi:hypothetical protein
MMVLVVVDPQGQFSSVGMPTTALRQTSASVALGGRSPEGAQMHGSGSQTSSPTETFKMNRQSVAVGSLPELRGCEQPGTPGRLVVVVGPVVVVTPTVVVVTSVVVVTGTVVVTSVVVGIAAVVVVVESKHISLSSLHI